MQTTYHRGQVESREHTLATNLIAKGLNVREKDDILRG